MGVAMKIGEKAREKDISLKELSRQVNIPYTTLYNAVKRDSKMDFRTVQKIAVALGMRWSELYLDSSDKEFSVAPIDYEKMILNENDQERLMAAADHVEVLQWNAEKQSGIIWENDEKSRWLEEQIPMIAKAYRVGVDDLKGILQSDFEPEPFRVKNMEEEELLSYFRKLNDNGRIVAVEHLQELTEIARYQRPSDVTENAPSRADDKELVEE